MPKPTTDDETTQPVTELDRLAVMTGALWVLYSLLKKVSNDEDVSIGSIAIFELTREAASGPGSKSRADRPASPEWLAIRFRS